MLCISVEEGGDTDKNVRTLEGGVDADKNVRTLWGGASQKRTRAYKGGGG